MQSNNQMNRWLVVVGAILIQLCAGAIYAWSVYTTELTKKLTEGGLYGFTKAEAQLPFMIGLAAFAITTVIGGNWQKKSCPKNVAMTGGIVLGLGYILAGLLGSTLPMQIIFIGLIGGVGIGLAYVCPIACGVKWFPDKKGLITGLAVAGFGFGALIWMKLAGGFFGWPGLLAAVEKGGLHFAFCNNGSAIQSTWFLYGIIYLVVIVLGSIWMLNPPEGYCPIGWTPPTAAKAADSGGVEFNQKEMLGSPQFYMIWFCFMAGAMAGLMISGNIKLFATDALQVTGLSKEQAGAVAVMAYGVFFALSNGIGRIVWGLISDKIGRKNSIFIMCLTQGIFMILFFFVGKNLGLLYLWNIFLGFNFGGNFALYPSITADYFGNKTFGTNYGWMFTAYGVGGLLGPYIGGKFADTAATSTDLAARYQAWMPAFIIAGVLCLMAAVVIKLTPKPVKAEKAAA
jgi:MFS transporter, OFA family, oxalate/formate antiporter